MGINAAGAGLLKGFAVNPKSDVFSLGCLFYNLVAGKMLFSGPDTQAVLFKNKYLDTAKTIDSTCPHVSEECRDLMRMMTRQNITNRPTAEQCLHHDWFKKDRD